MYHHTSTYLTLTGCLVDSNALCNLVFDTILCQLINARTQIKNKTLDLVFSNSDGLVKDLDIDQGYVHI